MAINKVILNNEVKLDLSQDTIEACDVRQGKSFHRADGTIQIGTWVPQIPDGYIKPEGTLTIKENGSYDVTNYAEAIVDIESSNNNGGDDSGNSGDSNSGDITLGTLTVNENGVYEAGGRQIPQLGDWVQGKVDLSSLDIEQFRDVPINQQIGFTCLIYSPNYSFCLGINYADTSTFCPGEDLVILFVNNISVVYVKNSNTHEENTWYQWDWATNSIGNKLDFIESFGATIIQLLMVPDESAYVVPMERLLDFFEDTPFVPRGVELRAKEVPNKEALDTMYSWTSLNFQLKEGEYVYQEINPLKNDDGEIVGFIYQQIDDGEDAHWIYRNVYLYEELGEAINDGGGFERVHYQGPGWYTGEFTPSGDGWFYTDFNKIDGIPEETIILPIDSLNFDLFYPSGLYTQNWLAAAFEDPNASLYGIDGFDKVIVDVTPNVSTITIKQNGEYLSKIDLSPKVGGCYQFKWDLSEVDFDAFRNGELLEDGSYLVLGTANYVWGRILYIPPEVTQGAHVIRVGEYDYWVSSEYAIPNQYGNDIVVPSKGWWSSGGDVRLCGCSVLIEEEKISPNVPTDAILSMFMDGLPNNNKYKVKQTLDPYKIGTHLQQFYENRSRISYIDENGNSKESVVQIQSTMGDDVIHSILFQLDTSTRQVHEYFFDNYWNYANVVEPGWYQYEMWNEATTMQKIDAPNLEFTIGIVDGSISQTLMMELFEYPNFDGYDKIIVNTLNGTNTNDATATSADILSDKTAYVKGQKIIGGIPLQSAKIITPSTSEQVAISLGYYASGDVKVQGDANLIAKNIKKGATIFGVEGNFEGNEVSKLGGLVDGTPTEITAKDLAGATKINDYAFYYNQGLTNIVIPNSVTSIGQYAFFQCSMLQSIEIPDSVTSIGVYAFQWCTSIKSAIIGNGVTSISSDAFRGCSNLTSVVIGNSVTSIGYEAFDDCSSLKSIVIPNSVTSIGSYAFSSCDKLQSVVVGNGVTTIGDYAFMRCYDLTSLEIGNNVTSIGKKAFAECSWSLKSIVIPNSVTSIGDLAFDTCRQLKRIDFSNHTTIPTIGSTIFKSTNSTLQIKVPTNLIDEWKSATNWATYASKIVTEFTNTL